MGEPISQTGEPMPFRWDVTECGELLADLQRYENELTQLLDSEDSAWASTEVVRCATSRFTKLIMFLLQMGV